jgi:hypothetical protein
VFWQRADSVWGDHLHGKIRLGLIAPYRVLSDRTEDELGEIGRGHHAVLAERDPGLQVCRHATPASSRPCAL